MLTLITAFVALWVLLLTALLAGWWVGTKLERRRILKVLAERNGWHIMIEKVCGADDHLPAHVHVQMSPRANPLNAQRGTVVEGGFIELHGFDENGNDQMTGVPIDTEYPHA